MADGKVITINREPGRFVSDTQHLSCLEIGAYNQICDNIVILGQDEEPPSLPDDDLFLANIAKLSLKVWRHMKPRLCTGQLAVLTVEDGRISQARVVEEIENAKHRIATSSRGGVKSGEVRRRKADVLRERMMNSTSKSGSTPLRSPVELHYELEANSERTSHESLVTSHEVQGSNSGTALQVSSSSLTRLARDGKDERETLSHLLKELAPQMRRVSVQTLNSWLSKFSPDPWQLGAVMVLKADYLLTAGSSTYLTRIFEERASEDGFNMREPRSYVEMFTSSQFRAQVGHGDDADRTDVDDIRERARAIAGDLRTYVNGDWPHDDFTRRDAIEYIDYVKSIELEHAQSIDEWMENRRD